jgi:glutamate-1-semialdehyde 2,1-aminomutase
VVVDRRQLAEVAAAEAERFAVMRPRSAELAAQRRHLLTGVPMPWMVRWAGPFALPVDAAAGGRFTDVDGHEYVDFCLGDTGAMTGHALAAVAEAVTAQVRRGITTMLPSRAAETVAGELTRRFGVGSWQFAMTATDANRFVLRLARAATNRSRVVVMDWCYHGTVDETLAVIGPDGSAMSRPGALGPPVPVANTTRVVPFNEPGALAAALAEGDVAAVLMEPALTNIGIVLPEPGYLDEVRRLTRQHGTLLVIDETHTICAGPGGCTAAWGLEPDAVVIGKTIGGGVPVAAYGLAEGFAAAVAPLLADPAVDVSGIGGTLAGNALAIAAAEAALTHALRDEDFAVAIPLAQRWTDGVATAVSSHQLDWHVQRLGCRAEYWFCPPPRTGAQAASADDAELAACLHLWALNRGILLTPFHNMALVAPSHTVADVDRHSEVFAAALDALTR